MKRFTILLVGLLVTGVSLADQVKETFYLKNSGYHLSATRYPASWESSLSFLNDHTVQAQVTDYDGDAYIKVIDSKNPKRYCVIDAGRDIYNGKPAPSVLTNFSNLTCRVVQTQQLVTQKQATYWIEVSNHL